MISAGSGLWRWSVVVWGDLGWFRGASWLVCELEKDSGGDMGFGLVGLHEKGVPEDSVR